MGNREFNRNLATLKIHKIASRDFIGMNLVVRFHSETGLSEGIFWDFKQMELAKSP